MPDGTGGWSISDLNSFAGIGSLFVTVGGLLHLRGRRDARAEAAKETAEEALKRVDDLARGMANCKLACVKEFIPRSEVTALEDRIGFRLETLGSRVEASIAKLGDRIDRLAEK